MKTSIKDQFDDFGAHVFPPECDKDQIADMKMAFYGGAIAAVAIVGEELHVYQQQKDFDSFYNNLFKVCDELESFKQEMRSKKSIQ